MRTNVMFRRIYYSFTKPFSTTSTTDTNNSTIIFGRKRLESLEWLNSLSPCFPINGNQVKLIFKPDEFYNNLMTMYSNAKQRIFMASLYFGTGQLENSLMNAIRENIAQNPDIQVNILIDYTRGTRGLTESSKNLLQPLVVEGKNVLFSMYHTPNLRGLVKYCIPARWNELIGLQHMKIYIADDTVIISGANLSNDYFTNRQDRYIMITDKNISDFYAKLIEKVQDFSLQVSSNGEFTLHSNGSSLPYKGSRSEFVNNARTSIENFMAETKQVQHLRISEPDKTGSEDTWVYPLIEMGQFNLHHDSIATEKIFTNALPESKLNIATGYFNLTQTYMNALIASCKAKCDILMAHPTANGFLGAKGIANNIPSAYSQIAKNFYVKLRDAGQTNRIHLYEYQRPGWTYHAKGLWYYLPESTLPDLTLIGSSNFGERSVNRDLESQLCLVTVNDKLRERLQQECDLLREHCNKADGNLMQRVIARWLRPFVFFFRSYF